MPERRYSDEEVRRILTNAVEVDSSMVARDDGGLTLDQIQTIAAEAGLSPASVTTAVAALEQESRMPATPRVLGLRVGVANTIVFPGTIEDAQWRRLVAFLQDTFEAKGREDHGSGRREWRNGNLRVAAIEGDGTTLLYLRTRKGSALSLIRAGGALLLGSLVVGAASVLAQSGMNALAPAFTLALGGLAMATVGALQLPSWSSARQRQFEDVAEYARLLTTGTDE